MTYAACPISSEKTDHNTVRVTGLLTILALATFAATGSVVLAALLAADCSVRAWTSSPSPMQRVGARIARAVGLPVLLKDKAPKRFAARIGWMFAVGAVGLSFISPVAGVAVGLTWLGFNVLDSVFGFCVGCWVYTNLAFPLEKRLTAA